MSTILDVLRASGGTDVEIITIQLSCTAWDESLYWFNGFYYEVFTLERGDTVTFTAVAVDLGRQKRSNSVSESLGVAIDNVRNEAEPLVASAKAAGAQILMTLRSFLESNPEEPAELPVTLKVLRASFDNVKLSLTASNPDLVNIAWPRDRYTVDFAPGITYIA